MNSWDYRFLHLAQHISSWSKDPTTKVGAVIVDHKKRVISLGYNGFPRGVIDYNDRYTNRDIKLSLVCHAERNALDNAPSNVEGFTMYSTLYPCKECAKSIIQNGITRLCCPKPIFENNKYGWETSELMFFEAGVSVEYFEH